MTKEQLETIAGMIAGTQMAIVTLVDVLKNCGVSIDRSEVAAHFDRDAIGLSAEMRNRELVAMVLRHTAIVLRGDKVNSAEEISRLLH